MCLPVGAYVLSDLKKNGWDTTPAFLSFLQAGDISSPGGTSRGSACIRALEHKTRARTPDTATQIISQRRLSAHSLVFYNTLDKNVLVPGTEYFFFMFFHRHAAWLLMNMRCKQVYVIDFFFFFFYLYCTVLITVLISVKISLLYQPFILK